MGEILQALPDLHIAIDDVMEDGDRAALRWTARATHAGGLGAPATGRTVQIHGLIWMEFRDGKLMHAWDGWNHDGFLRLLLAPEGGDGVVYVRFPDSLARRGAYLARSFRRPDLPTEVRR